MISNEIKFKDLVITHHSSSKHLVDIQVSKVEDFIYQDHEIVIGYISLIKYDEHVEIIGDQNFCGIEYRIPKRLQSEEGLLYSVATLIATFLCQQSLNNRVRYIDEELLMFLSDVLKHYGFLTETKQQS